MPTWLTVALWIIWVLWTLVEYASASHIKVMNHPLNAVRRGYIVKPTNATKCMTLAYLVLTILWLSYQFSRIGF